MNGAAKDDPDSRRAEALLDAIDQASGPAVDRAADSSGRSAAKYASKAPHVPPAARSGPAVPEPAVIVEPAPPAPWSSPRVPSYGGLPAPPPDGQTVLVDRSKLVRPVVATASSREKLLAFVTMAFVVSACGIGLLLVGSRRARRHVVVPAPVAATAPAAASAASAVGVVPAEPRLPSPPAARPSPAPTASSPPERPSQAAGLLGASSPEPTPPSAPPARRARPPVAPTPGPAASPPPPPSDGELKSHFER